ncbi:MAG: TlpA family protein disulfide reductase [Saprospiraceae bacterium]|jgi:peroxiredoxin|nr:TlpA family protein disulfide reductase [Saprospiraceae bacterium]HRD79706.1 TlpA disulfide reductase family protein [Saprospiraceae bacterium]
MNRIQLFTFVFCLLASVTAISAQKSIPSVEIKTLDGKTVNIQKYTQSGKITVLSFWATWCKPCQQELDAISEVYPEWQEKYGVQLVAVTIDTQRALAKVGPMVESKGWEYIILSDPNGAMPAALNFQSIPQTFLLDAKGNVIYEHTGYIPGNEFDLEEKIKAAAGKK